ncbi:tRNA pseudouridine synthase domain-containing protein [Ordospora colligata]|uniref:tRNA pseudouridine synthase n=1 Tax=Ordospora colligata OC4 TaxID=1354746 RepID=A0A0B2UCZ1_9MICR|nr:tRNA pseudouridine synthase domain-containing protein [Ordospora colligata OC4]KHN68926.1 tRNA pseudouridine synthase domain-containing protein [Ordospora colligata OC4]TBU13960.1 tRNA pseudouridine synthase domain-containing protein [Ordospora colligata]TBU14149.1 tRNA pseudouridine synthase domain-containing protein [Ordospora colligata]TBU17818.1 tRNA pseudouridine synthase domain-containing protein [Ordospora colligata]
MLNDYYEYLQTLDKDKLIEFLYQPKVHKKTFTGICMRMVALKISYDGRKYSGVARQFGKQTIDGYISNALEITGLGSKLVYAGRTDAGVSAVGMIASVHVVSRIANPSRGYTLGDEDHKEYRYDLILNTYLPEDIRVIGWAPVPDDFSARFTCIQRQYRYYFHKDSLDLSKMQDSTHRIKGMTNFYYFCKHSDKNALYERTIDECRIIDDGDMYYLDIKARAFLHNMVRKIIWAILKDGRGEAYDEKRIGLEEPYPLVFYNAIYPEELQFIMDQRCNMLFDQQIRDARIRCKIAKLRFEHSCQGLFMDFGDE